MLPVGTPIGIVVSLFMFIVSCTFSRHWPDVTFTQLAQDDDGDDTALVRVPPSDVNVNKFEGVSATEIIWEE